MKNIEILYENEFFIVINKPAGLAVQGGKGIKTSLDKILADIRNPPPLLVHRLDKETSGLLLAAKGKEAAAGFSRIFRNEQYRNSSCSSRGILKQYTAVCSGSLEKKEGNIKDDLLIRNSIKKSETRYKVIKIGKLDKGEGQEFSVLELEPSTGRMHQIRRHLAMLGNPILGDDKYGDFTLNKKLRKTACVKRLLLHSSRLVIKEFNLDISAPLPEYFNLFYQE